MIGHDGRLVGSADHRHASGEDRSIGQTAGSCRARSFSTPDLSHRLMPWLIGMFGEIIPNFSIEIIGDLDLLIECLDCLLEALPVNIKVNVKAEGLSIDDIMPRILDSRD
jgi:hypothetical protein